MTLNTIETILSRKGVQAIFYPLRYGPLRKVSVDNGFSYFRMGFRDPIEFLTPKHALFETSTFPTLVFDKYEWKL